MMNFRIKFHIFRESAVLGKMGISARAKFFYHRHGQKILPSVGAKNFLPLQVVRQTDVQLIIDGNVGFDFVISLHGWCPMG